MERDLQLKVSHASSPYYFANIGLFPQKSHIVSGSLTERHLQLTASHASSPPFGQGYQFVNIGQFPQKSPGVSGSFAERDL